MTEAENNALERLRELPECDTDERTAERVRRLASDAFVAERALASRPWWVAAAVRAGRIAAPLLLASTAGAYLTWALRVAISVYP